MFGGLSLKEDDDPKEGEAPPPSAGVSGSGFSFLQSMGAKTTEDPAPDPNEATAPQPPPVAGTSGFSFMSGESSVAPPDEPGPTTGRVAESSASTSDDGSPSMFTGLNTTVGKVPSSPQAANAAEPTLSGGGSSGFSFMSKSSPQQATPLVDQQPVVDNAGPESSSFSFLTNGGSASESNPADPPNMPVLEEKKRFDAPVGGGGSGFSFMAPSASVSSSLPPSVTDSADADQAHVESNGLTTATPSSPARNSDLLSMQNATLSAGAGVSWGAPPVGMSTSRKVVKKKRGKRVGVGSSSSAPDNVMTSIPEPVEQQQQPPPPSFQSPPIPASTPTKQLAPMTIPSSPAHVNTHPQQPETPPTPMLIKAERAANKADEFLREKQRSAISVAAERAILDKATQQQTPVEPGWKTENAAAGPPPSPNDETYQSAKAAAEEARQLASSASAQTGKTSLFGSFFNRKIGSNNSAMGTHSSHGGVVGSSPAAVKSILASFQRSNSGADTASVGGSVASRSSPTLPPTKEPPLDVPTYGLPADSVPPAVVDTEKLKEQELEIERRRMELEQKQREEAAEARRKAEAEAAEAERLRLIEEEKRRTPRQKMQAILDTFADVAHTSADNVFLLREKRSRLIKEKLEAQKAERYADQQVKFSEAQQTLAAEDEDFEAADRLGAVIENHSKERESKGRIVQQITDRIAELDMHKETALNAVSSCFEDVSSKLKALEDEVDDREKEQNEISQFAATSKRLSSESERLTNDLKHIERDEKVLSEEESELQGQIGEETKEFDEKSAEASGKLEEVNKTIEDLRRRLAEAESNAATLQEEISGYEECISAVRTKYSRQILRLEKKSKSVSEARADWESEKDSIEKAKVAHEAVVTAHSEEMITREKSLEEIRKESATAKEFVGLISHAFKDDSGDAEGEQPDSLDGEVLKFEAVVAEASQNVVAAEAAIKSLNDELETIAVRVPIFEAEKKQAASKRDFKAAGKASREIKNALARKEKCEADLAGEAGDRLRFTKDELEKITAILEQKKSAALDKSKEAGKLQMIRLQGKITDLKSKLKKYLAEPVDIDTVNVVCIGAFVIESQIGILETQGKSLGEKYGGWVSSDDQSVQSAPTFDSDDGAKPDPPDESPIAIDASIVEKYDSLQSEIKRLDAEIEMAAENEDYDKAASLEDTASGLRSEFDDAGFGSERFRTCLEKYRLGQSKQPENNAVISDATLDQYTVLCDRVNQLEEEIELAAADEEYDLAAEKEDELQAIKSEIECLGFTTADLDDALKCRQSKCSSEEEPQDKQAPDGANDESERCDEGKEESNSPEADGGEDPEAAAPTEVDTDD